MAVPSSVHLALPPALPAHALVGALLLRWRWLALSLVIALTACLEFVGLDQEGYANTYYAAGVKSMLTSWHNFFFVSSDAGGLVALDKPPLGLWIEAASAKIFGFSGMSLLAPEAVAGILSVVLVYHLVGRSFGSMAGLLSALMLSLTPISAIVDRNNTVDSLLIFTLLLAVWAVTVATERASLRWLLIAALVVGLAFNIKMLQAYLVVPALLLVYLFGAHLPWRTRLMHLALAVVVILVVSFSWVAIVDLTPAGQRPFVSDSGTNSELSLVLGYNGLGRLTQALFPGVTQISILGDPIDLTIVPAVATGIGDPGLFRLVSADLGGQASWFLLPALAGLLALVRFKRPLLPLGTRGQAVLLWSMWLLVAGCFFSTGRFFHLYYLVMIAPPIAALAGIGLSTMWREYRQSLELPAWREWRGWLLPVTLVGTALLQVRFLNDYPSWSGALAILVVGGSLLAAATLAAGRLGVGIQITPESLLRVTPAVAAGCMVLGMLALVAAPANWTVASIAGGAGGSWLPQAGSGTFGGRPGGQGGGPGGFGAGGQGGFGTIGAAFTGVGAPQGGTGGPGAQPAFGGEGSGMLSGGNQSGFNQGGGRGGFGLGGGGNGAMTFAGGNVQTLDPGLLSYLEKNQGKARYLVATTTSSYASLFILQTSRLALALGGYQGWDRVLTLAQLKTLVAGGTVRFFYLPVTGTGQATAGGSSAQHGGTATTQSRAAASQSLSSVNGDLTIWVQSTCKAVPATTYQSTSISKTSGSIASSAQRGQGAGGSLQLYDCAGKAT